MCQITFNQKLNRKNVMFPLYKYVSKLMCSIIINIISKVLESVETRKGIMYIEIDCQ